MDPFTSPRQPLLPQNQDPSKSGQQALVASEKTETTPPHKHQAWGPITITQETCTKMEGVLDLELVVTVLLHCRITWRRRSLQRLESGHRARQGRGHRHRRGTGLDRQRKGFLFLLQTLIAWEWVMETTGTVWGVQASRVWVDHTSGWSSNQITPLAARKVLAVVRFLRLQPATLGGGWDDLLLL